MFCVINLIGPCLNTVPALAPQHLSSHPFSLSQCWQLCSSGLKETTNMILGDGLCLSLKLSPRSSGTEVIIPLLPLGITHKGSKIHRGNVWNCHPLPLSRKESSWCIPPCLGQVQGALYHGSQQHCETPVLLKCECSPPATWKLSEGDEQGLGPWNPSYLPCKYLCPTLFRKWCISISLFTRAPGSSSSRL